MTQLQTLQTENAHLRENANATATANHPPPQHPKTKAPDRPVINTNTDEREWELFKDSWSRYKAMAAITDTNMLCMELRAACSQDVNKLLFEYVGATNLNAADETQLLEHIKSVAVKDTHKEVHRMKFFRLSQTDGESITQYVARLRSQAVLCQFKIRCPDHEQQSFVSYADDMITQQLVSGLQNQQHQSRILSEATALPTLRDKIERLQCLESTEQSTDLMRLTSTPFGASTSAPARSTYKRGKTATGQQSNQHNHQCIGCGRTSHEGKTMARKDCPAYNKNCGNCGIKGHFRAVCRKKSSNSSQSKAAAEPSDTDSVNPDEGADLSFSFATQDFRLAPNATGQT